MGEPNFITRAFSPLERQGSFNFEVKVKFTVYDSLTRILTKEEDKNQEGD